MYYIRNMFFLKSTSKTTDRLQLLKGAFNNIDLLRFAVFYKQLKKYQARKETYRIDYVIKNVYPDLSDYSLQEIESYVNESQVNDGSPF